MTSMWFQSNRTKNCDACRDAGMLEPWTVNVSACDGSPPPPGTKEDSVIHSAVVKKETVFLYITLTGWWFQRRLILFSDA